MAPDAATTSLLRPLAEDLAARRAQIKLGGGAEKIAAQHAADKLTARERIALLIDEGTFVELGIHGRPHFSQRAMDGKDAAADGVITGYGKVDGRLTAVAAYDFTVMAGSMGMTGELKVTRLRELALTKRIPFVWLLDSAGARIQEAVGSLFAGTGHLFRDEVISSGVIPQVAALMGPCAAGTAYIPGLADFVPMVKGRGSMALAGPHLVRAAIGEDVTQEELGGSRVHCRKSGVGDLEVADDQDCIEQIKRYLSFFPSNCEEAVPVRAATDPIDRADEELLDVLPESNRKPYDMYEVIRRIVDDGVWFDMKPQFAKTIITCFARIGGRPVGIVANQPKYLGGVLDAEGSEKAARFVGFCNSFGLPLVVVVDTPGFMPGSRQEQAGVIRHGAALVRAFASARVPKLTVVLRKSYGGAYITMNSRDLGADLVLAWPDAELGIMSARAAVGFVHRRELRLAGDSEAERGRLADAYAVEHLRADAAAAAGFVDEIIEPGETRARLAGALRTLAGGRL
jgi:acetyl-CoA carboxylase carboxyltransferase component